MRKISEQIARALEYGNNFEGPRDKVEDGNYWNYSTLIAVYKKGVLYLNKERYSVTTSSRQRDLCEWFYRSRDLSLARDISELKNN